MSQSDLFSYPDAPGFKRDGTSREAAEEMKGKAPILREQVLTEIRAAGLHGRTADEVADRLRANPFAVRPRLSELVKNGLIHDSQRRRINASGKRATVWVAST